MNRFCLVVCGFWNYVSFFHFVSVFESRLKKAIVVSAYKTQTNSSINLGKHGIKQITSGIQDYFLSYIFRAESWIKYVKIADQHIVCLGMFQLREDRSNGCAQPSGNDTKGRAQFVHCATTCFATDCLNTSATGFLSNR
uniref:Secreted protein n=1 Tax=Acrobeloides nanus TaxID=290746 RepID=A0A914C6M1_9BILA